MTPKENLLRVLHHDHPAWVPNGLESVKWFSAPMAERPNVAGADIFGVAWSLNPEAEGGTYPTEGHPVITDLRHWREQLRIPDAAQFDWQPIADAVAAIDREQYLVQGGVEMGLFERSYLLLGMEEALIAYLQEPELMRDMLEALADFKIAVIAKFYEVAQPDFINYGDDWGTQSNLFVPPETWRAVIKPPTQRIYQACLARGIMINQHSCGYIAPILGDIVDMGATIWNPCQPCNDLAALKQRYGARLTFMGGIDSQFVLDRPGVTPAEVRTEVRKRIDEMADGGGYIAGPSHGVPYEQELIEAMYDEIAVYGRIKGKGDFR